MAASTEQQHQPSWPKAASERYEPVRPLGKGAFGMVWLAKRRDAKDDESIDSLDADPRLVAIKRIKCVTDTEKAYAEREIQILSELRHPNIIRIITDYPSPKSRLVVMSLAPGPEIGSLVRTGGALSIPLSCLVARHLIASISYCHGRGVIHRDVKPENMVLVSRTAAGNAKQSDEDYFSDDTLWCKTGDNESDESMEAKWKVMLIDFGFARALSPADLEAEEKKGGDLRGSILNEGKGLSKIDEKKEDGKAAADDDFFAGGGEDGVAHTPRPNAAAKKTRGFNRGSVAKLTLAMSALGTKSYAAPEVLNKARHKNEKEEATGLQLTENVSSYGTIADAFSTGVAIRVVMTGVDSCETDITGYISSQNNPLLLLFSCFGNKKRKKQYRYPSDLPKDAFELIRDLTKFKVEDRMSVRQAQTNTFICGRDGETKYELPQGDFPSKHGDVINYLKCVS